MLGRLKTRVACGWWLVLSSSSAAILAAAPAAAQTTQPSVGGGEVGGGELEEVVVTARKRSESLLNVPVAISVLGKTDIERNVVTDMTKVALLVPQVSIANVGRSGTGGIIVIRGISTANTDSGLEQQIAVEIDGLQTTKGRSSMETIFDIENIQVLKGPQALFFGKNSPAGVIDITTANPTRDFEGYAKAGYEFNAQERWVETAVSGPVADSLGFRIAVRADSMRGWMQNLAQPEPDTITGHGINLPGTNSRWGPDARDIAGRLTLKWDPTEAFSAKLKLQLSDYQDNTGVIDELLCAPGVLPSSGGAVQHLDPTGVCGLQDKYSHGSTPTLFLQNWPQARDGNPFVSDNEQIGTLTLNDDASMATFTAVSAVQHYNFSTLFPTDYTSLADANSTDVESWIQGSEEVRALTKFAGPMNVMVGGFYEGTRGFHEIISDVGEPYPAYAGAGCPTGCYFTYAVPSITHGRTLSAFGQAIWDVTTDLEFAAGARWTQEYRDINMSNSFANANSIFFSRLSPVGVHAIYSHTWNNISPEATLTWHPTRTTTLYAAFKTGYQSGGFSQPSLMGPSYDPTSVPKGKGIAGDIFNPEKARGGEIGAKGVFFDGRLTVNSDVYLYDFTQYQVSSFNSITTSFLIGNAAAARTKGAEAELVYAPNHELSLNGSVGYNEAYYSSYAAAPCWTGQAAVLATCPAFQDLTGQPLPRAPRWSTITGFSYDAPTAASNLRLGLSGNAKYTSGYFMGEEDEPLGWQGGFFLIDASIRLHPANDKWELALIGQNLLNRQYGLEGQDKPVGPATGGLFSLTPGRSRELIVQGTARF